MSQLNRFGIAAALAAAMTVVSLAAQAPAQAPQQNVPTPRTANVVKAAVNYDIIHAMEAIGESLTLVESEGVDANEFVELLRSTLFGGVVYTSYGDIIANRRYHPAGFDISLGLKDLGLAEDIAAAAGVDLPTAGALRGVFEEALADPELHDADWSAIAEITRRRLRRAR